MLRSDPVGARPNNTGTKYGIKYGTKYGTKYGIKYGTHDYTHVRKETTMHDEILIAKIAAALTLLGFVPENRNDLASATLLQDTLRHLGLEIKPR